MHEDEIEFLRCYIRERRAMNVMLSATLDYLYPRTIEYNGQRYIVSSVEDPSVLPD